MISDSTLGDIGVYLAGRIHHAGWQMHEQWHDAPVEVLTGEDGRLVDVDFTIDATAIPLGGEVQALRLMDEQGKVIMEKQVLIRLDPSRLTVPYRVILGVGAEE